MIFPPDTEELIRSAIAFTTLFFLGLPLLALSAFGITDHCRQQFQSTPASGKAGAKSQGCCG